MCICLCCRVMRMAVKNRRVRNWISKENRTANTIHAHWSLHNAKLKTRATRTRRESGGRNVASARRQNGKCVPRSSPPRAIYRHPSSSTSVCTACVCSRARITVVTTGNKETGSGRGPDVSLADLGGTELLRLQRFRHAHAADLVGWRHGPRLAIRLVGRDELMMFTDESTTIDVSGLRLCRWRGY